MFFLSPCSLTTTTWNVHIEMRQGETQIQADVDIGHFTHLFLVWGNFHADETLLSPQSAGC